MSDNDQLIWLPPHRVITQVSILAEKLDYAHKMMNIPHMWKETKGAGVKVCVIDTGTPNHVDIGVAGSDSTIPGYSEDKNGHATHCGGIIAAIANNGLGVAGISPEVEDYYIAALNAEGSGSITQITTAILKAVDEMGVDVISMSLGIPGGYANFRSMEAACDYAVDQGVTVIAAAGNENSGVGQPACYDSVIAVAAVDSAKKRAWFSNQGSEVDFAAPGVDVYSTYLKNRYAKLSGTSMACPMLAGIAALIIADAKDDNEILTPADVRAKLRKIAYDIGQDGLDESFGHGLPIFGHDGSGEPVEPPPEEPDEPSGSKKGMPEANCVYWRMFGDFIDSVGSELDGGRSMEGAVAAGLRKLRAHKTGINILIAK
jgi:subtilisin